MHLTPAQQGALTHVREAARARSSDAQAVIAHVLRMSDVSPADFASAVAAVQSSARVALHFHPDRPRHDGVTIVDGLTASGVYKSQFETGLSSGSVSAHAGGARDLWERDLFGGAYHEDGIDPPERPKYGALDLLGHADGPSPRFGSCYLLLRPAVSRRCTFTYLDSFRSPDERGTLEAFDDVWAALLADCFEREAVLGTVGVRPPQLVQRMQAQGADRRAPVSRNLDHYIEAQVHGPVELAADADMLVADPCFRGTPTGGRLEALCVKYGLALSWHPGFCLDVDAVPRDFRGPSMPSLADRIAGARRVDAHCIGQAARELQRAPAAWEDRGTPAEVLQELKLLWHCLVRFGSAWIPPPA